MKRACKWLRIAGLIVLCVSLIGCAGSCQKQETADEAPETEAPPQEQSEPVEITEDEVVTFTGTEDEESNPTLPPETEAPETPAPTQASSGWEEFGDDPTPTATGKPTGTPTATPRRTATPRPTAKRTATPRPTTKPTATAKPTATPQPTATPRPTATPDNGDIVLPELP